LVWKIDQNYRKLRFDQLRRDRVEKPLLLGENDYVNGFALPLFGV
jgi:hypothetical protein